MKRAYTVLKWASRILGAVVLLFGLPFYVGYGNPMPFRNPGYSMYDNTWLAVFPLIVIGLALGWKWPKLGGFLITIPILFGFVVSLVIKGELPVHMMVPFTAGLAYIITAFIRSE